MARYLVTGGCGFIGSHLVDRLLQDNHRVCVLDNLSSGKRENLSTAAELIIGDIRDETLISDIVQEMDGCFHMAAVVSIEQCRMEWFDSYQVNLSGTVGIFDAVRKAAKSGVEPIPVVYASSCAVYGENCHLPSRETERPQPISSYGLDKWCCELYGRISKKIYNIPTVGLRFFNVFGTRQNVESAYAAVIPIFIKKILSDDIANVYGDGEQTRDFIYIEDVVDACLLAMKNKTIAPEIFNVCTGQQTSLNTLIKILEELTGRSLKRKYLQERAGDIRHSYGDLEKIHKKLGFSPKFDLRKGLGEVLDLGK